ncbi:chemokine XC receptor 1-like [Pimephales promelas]|uniref:chemokine XC receptor 1-like n=1 Tax=Pimephales promelas TaxID=90988 RepID=UPI0019555CEF|nr:chemokine XC receptor 1-like [Pimephales promelas]
MNNSTMNFTTTEASNLTTHSIGLMDYLEISVYSINLLFGFPTHCYIIWLIITGTGSGVASEFFILNLSVCELGICLNSVVFVLSIWFPTFSSFYLFLIGLSFTGRPVFQCLMCVERYLAVVHPVTFLKYKPLRYRVICCAAVWVINLVSCLCSLFNLSSPNRYIHRWLSTMLMILIVSIQLFCVVAVLRALKQTGPGERKREKKEENHMKRRAFNIILITTVSMVILYVPKIITGFSEIHAQSDNSPARWFTSLTLFIIAGFVQPVLFLHRTGKFSCLCSS